MRLKQNDAQTNGFKFDETYTLKPAFRIFSRSSESSGWAVFFASKPAVVYPNHSVIVTQGEENPNIFYIVRGLVEYTSIDENGSDHILEILGPGNMLNLQPVFGRNPSIGTFSALSECILASAHKEEILKQMKNDDRLLTEMLEAMAFIIGGLNRQKTISTERSDIRALRVIHMIAMISRRVYQEDDPICIRMSQNDLARIVQTTRVTISKILSDMKKKGVIDTDYGNISIIDTDLLLKVIKEKAARSSSPAAP